MFFLLFHNNQLQLGFLFFLKTTTKTKLFKNISKKIFFSYELLKKFKFKLIFNYFNRNEIQLQKCYGTLDFGRLNFLDVPFKAKCLGLLFVVFICNNCRQLCPFFSKLFPKIVSFWYFCPKPPWKIILSFFKIFYWIDFCIQRHRFLL